MKTADYADDTDGKENQNAFGFLPIRDIRVIRG
jgi:hypothetical protein